MKKVLIADDEESAREILREILNSAGYETIEAADGYEALNLAREEKPDLIILDIMMPQLSGWEVMLKMKNDEEISSIPILISTAKEETKPLFREQLGTGVEGFLSKPYRAETMLSEVKKILEGK